MSALGFGLRACTSTGSGGSTTHTTQTQGSTQATHRTPLDPSKSTLSAWYQDDDGDWILDQDLLIRGLEDFYERTGVRPYVHILKNGTTTSGSELTRIAEEEYGTLFSDEGHFLLVFCDDNTGGFNCGYVVGSDAETVMDDEAVKVLADYLDTWYQDLDISEEEIFANAFRDTARAIM